MNLRLLRYFTETVDAGSATRAAARLHVTQPVLSRQLRQLEQDIGLPLFERQGHRLRLTPAGEQFLPLARNLLRQADEVRRACASIASGRLDQLHLAVPTTTLNDVLAPFLATLHPDDPVPIVRQLDPRGADAALSSGADLAIVPRPPARHLASHALAVLPIWAQVRRDDPWAGRPTVDVGELAERALLLLTVDFRPRQLLDEALDGTGLSYREVIECTNARVAQALAAAGRGVAVVSDDPRFDLAPVAVTGPAGPVRISLYAAWDPHHHAATALAALAGRLAAFCAEQYGPDVVPASGAEPAENVDPTASTH
ncbi:LysR family transcriptional regulator [Kineosporia sp. NBRC 101731]|uniref:LysR family transcriptional regulator n=1 Tax=Kineosporia sp. NBRC 101731 TaxID=3032199 RepID=UPI0024A20A75|nr:LysR family transcriptional regulator [Kineosporia sp. NBRC 101731]GLY27887.1 LysR family transcriptional regulator [Kineosporia sp. NBRC 101731]